MSEVRILNRIFSIDPCSPYNDRHDLHVFQRSSHNNNNSGVQTLYTPLICFIYSFHNFPFVLKSMIALFAHCLLLFASRLFVFSSVWSSSLLRRSSCLRRSSPPPDNANTPIHTPQNNIYARPPKTNKVAFAIRARSSKQRSRHYLITTKTWSY